MDNNNVVVIITTIIQALTSIILFYLAFLKDNHINQNQVNKERLENLYTPFYKKYLTCPFLGDVRLSKFPLESRKEYLELFQNNIQYMDTCSQNNFIPFYGSYLILLDAYDDITIPFEETAKDFDMHFLTITKSLLCEHRQLCKQLKLPEPIEFF